MAKEVGMEFSFFEFLRSFYLDNKGIIRNRYREITKKYLDYNDKEKNPDAFLRKPQFEALEMYVFVKIQMPTISEGTLYLFDADNEWRLVSENGGTVVYAYGSTEMTVLSPGDSTSALTSQMTMQSISNAEYAAIDDINITITGYAIGTEGVSTNPTDAWNECKSIGNIQ